MKVGFLHKVNTTPPQSGGSIHTYQLSHYLARRGYELLALDNEQGTQFSSVFPRTFTGVRDLIAQSDLLYFRIDGRVGWELASCLPGLVKVSQPIVWEINATLDELKVLPEPLRWRDRLGSRLRSLSASKVTAAACVSAPLVDYAKDLGIENAVLVPNGSDPELFNPALRNPSIFPGLEHKFRVLWAGSTDYAWHDFDIVLDCAAQLQQIDPDICFIVMGKAPQPLPHELPSNIHFIKPVPYLEVPKFFASAHVGLSLYRNITWTPYGFFFSPLKLFDYAASGLPVIYSNFPELSRLASDFGLGINVGDTEELAKRLLGLKTNQARHASLSEKARQVAVNYYNWQRVGQQTEGIFKNLVSALPADCSKRVYEMTA